MTGCMRLPDTEAKLMSRRGERGQELIAYAVLVGAVILGVMAAASTAYRAFVGHAQTIERDEIVF